MKNTLSDAIKAAVINALDEEGLTISDVSNYNMSRAAGTGIFTIIFYKNVKTNKGDKRTARLKLDSSTSTLVAALDVIDSMIREDASKSFLAANSEPKIKGYYS